SALPPGASPGTGSKNTGGPGGAGGVNDVKTMKHLCQQYAQATRRGSSLAPVSQARLIEAAGGAGRIDAYCAQLTGTGGSSPDPRPTPSTSPSTDSAGTSGGTGIGVSASPTVEATGT